MIYLLHFDEPFKHARHYLGWTASAETLPARLEHHFNGTGANILKWAGRAGVAWSVVRTWPDGSKTRERQLKNNGHVPRLCPICRVAYNERRRARRRSTTQPTSPHVGPSAVAESLRAQLRECPGEEPGQAGGLIGGGKQNGA